MTETAASGDAETEADAAAQAPPSETGAWRSLAGAMIGVAAFAVTATLSYPLLSLIMERAGWSAGWIGANAAMASIGMLCAPLLARAMARLGVETFVALCLLVCMATLATFPLLDAERPSGVAAMFATRFVFGAATAGVFFATEYWVVSAAPPALRGRVVAVYVTIVAAGFAAGPGVLLLSGVEGWPPFLWAIGLCAATLGAIWALRGRAPAVERRTAARGPWTFLRSDPAVLFGVALFGAMEFGSMGLLPIWGLALGFPEHMAVMLAAAAAFGGVLIQPAIGWAADRAPARPMLLGAALIAGVTIAAAAAAQSSATGVILLLILWGGAGAALYTLSLAALGARYRGAELADANAALIAGYGAGALLGPPLIGGAMDAAGPIGLPATLALLCAGYALIVGARMAQSARA